MTPEEHQHEDEQFWLAMGIVRYCAFGGKVPQGVPREMIPGLWRAQRLFRIEMLALVIGAVLFVVIRLIVFGPSPTGG